MKRRKNSSSGSSSCGCERLWLAVALLVVMTFTTAGPSLFMRGVKSGSATSRSPLLLVPPDDADASRDGAAWTTKGPASEVLAGAASVRDPQGRCARDRRHC